MFKLLRHVLLEIASCSVKYEFSSMTMMLVKINYTGSVIFGYTFILNNFDKETWKRDAYTTEINEEKEHSPLGPILWDVRSLPHSNLLQQIVNKSFINFLSRLSLELLITAILICLAFFVTFLHLIVYTFP